MALCLNRHWSIFLVLLCVGGGCIASSPRAETRKSAGMNASRKAMEILKTECFACHNEEKKKGGLVLTSRELLLKGNKDGTVVTSGRPDESRLIKALSPDADPHMPPKKQLQDAQIKVIRDWIK